MTISLAPETTLGALASTRQGRGVPISTAARGVELSLQRAAGVGLAAFVAQSAAAAVIGRELYPVWWWTAVGPGLLAVLATTVALCLVGWFQLSRAVGAVALCSAGAALTSAATAGSVLREATAVTPLMMGMAGLVGFLLRPLPALVLGFGLITSLTASMALTRQSVHNDLVVLTAIMLALMTAGIGSGLVARRTAAAEDEAVVRLRRALIADRAAAATRADRRELERRLHDTVLNTLTALGRQSLADSAHLRARCAADARFLRELRRSHDHPPTADADDLIDALRRLVADSSVAGFDVTLHQPDSSPALPPAVVSALSSAAGEAVLNTRRHSGADHAEIVVRATGLGVEVAVTDRGSGLGCGNEHGGLGVQRSIVDRMADIGGRGEVRPGPDAGTVVTLTWPR